MGEELSGMGLFLFKRLSFLELKALMHDEYLTLEERAGLYQAIEYYRKYNNFCLINIENESVTEEAIDAALGKGNILPNRKEQSGSRPAISGALREDRVGNKQMVKTGNQKRRSFSP